MYRTVLAIAMVIAGTAAASAHGYGGHRHHGSGYYSRPLVMVVPAHRHHMRGFHHGFHRHHGWTMRRG